MSKKATKKPAKKSSKKKSGGGLEAAIAKYSKSSGFSKEKLRKVESFDDLSEKEIGDVYDQYFDAPGSMSTEQEL